MTTNKYKHNEYHCPLEDRLKSVEGDVRYIRKMTAGIYDRLGDVSGTTDAVYKSVMSHANLRDLTYLPEDDLDFLEED